MKRSKTSIIVSIILKITLVSGSICLFFIPKFYDLFYKTKEITFVGQTIYYQIAFYLCAILSLGIIYELIKIFDYINKNNPFNIIVEKRLKIIAVIFMILSVIVLIKVIYIPTLLSLVVVFLTFIGSLCIYALSQVFKKAIEYKEEMDVTI